MKFLCDNCKAKYQIADEKVAGKTVRMKCRKCGHQIEVRAAVTETSVASSPPQAPQAPRPRMGGGLATSLSAQKPKPHSHPPGALAGAFQQQVEQAPRTQPFPQTGSVEVNVSDEWYVAINGVPVGPVRISELRRKAASGAVTEESLCWQEGLEEWRPIRSIPELATLVREAAQGNRPSLVTPPPPDAGRASSPPRPPTPPPAPARPQPPVAPFGMTAPLGASAPPPRAPSPLRGVGPASPDPQGAPMRSNVVPLRPELEPAAAKASPLGSAAAALSLAPSISPTPAPTPAPPPKPMQTSDPFAVPPKPAVDPFAMPMTPSPFGALPVQPSNSSSSSIPLGPPAAATYSPSIPAEPPKRGGVPLWFWPIIVLSATFGAGLIWAIFIRQPPAPQIVVQQVPANPTAPTASAVASNDVPPPDTSAAPSASATTGGKIATGPRPKPRPGDPPQSGGGIDLSGLGGGGGGPAVGPGGGGGGGATGGGLDQAAIQNVVRNRSAGVRRTCWERGGPDQKSSANVTATITVAPNGSVQSASATGDDPVIAKCIENQVRTWTFPAPGQTTTINIPFHFVRQ